MAMNRIPVLLIAAGLILIAGIPVACAIECNRSFQVQIELTPSGASEKLTQVVYSSAPILNASAGDLRGEYLTRDGKTIASFWIWDPRVQLGEDVVMDKNGTATLSRGVLRRAARADLIILLPYLPDAGSFRLTDEKKTPLLTVNLGEAKNALTYNCTKEMYIPTTPQRKQAGPDPYEPVMICSGAVLSLVWIRRKRLS